MTSIVGDPSRTTNPGWFNLARALCFVIAVLAIGLVLLDIPFEYARYNTVCMGASCAEGQLTTAGSQQIQQAGLSVGFYAGCLTALQVAIVAVFLIMAALIFWRKSSDRMGVYASFTLAVFGVTFFSSALAPLTQHYPALLLPAQMLDLIGSSAFTIFFYLFPDGRFVPGWTRWLVPLVIAREALTIFLPQLTITDWFFYAEVASALYAQVYRYRRVSSAAERQQTKWVVFFSVIGACGFVGTVALVATLLPGSAASGLVYLVGSAGIYLFMMLIPLSIGVAILRSHLWDIDFLIRRTLIYGALTALLALIYLGAVVALQALVTALTGQQRSELVTVLSTLVIAALFVPLRNRLQALIDQRFYRRKYDAARTLAEFGVALRDEVDLDSLSAQLMAAVDETMQPRAVSLWLKSKDKG